MRGERPPDGQEESLADLFWAVAGRLRQLSRAGLEPLDITPSQSRALRVLARHDRLRAGELADRLRIAPRSATEVIDALEDRGLVHRFPDADDRRATLVALTDEGEALNRRMRAARAAEADALFAGLSSTDRAHLARILRRLRD